MRDDLKDKTTEELLEDLKDASIKSLSGEYEEPEEDSIKIKAQADFEKFTKLIKKQKSYNKELLELEVNNRDNIELQRYIELLNRKEKLEADIDKAKKGYLYESTVLLPDVEFENSVVKLTVVQPYEKEDFDKATFIKDYGPDTDMYKKYIVKKIVKGSVKFKIKE